LTTLLTPPAVANHGPTTPARQTPPPHDPAPPTPGSADAKLFKQRLAPFRKADARRAAWQLASTLAGFAALVTAMGFAYAAGWYWLGALLTLPAAGMIVRLFIFQHDCGHGSFFKSPRANRLVGYALSVFTHTPYEDWRHEHALHHASSGDLDHRGHGDVNTLTVDEYLGRNWLGRLQYRAYRHPLVMFGLFPTLLFLLRFRVPYGIPLSQPRRHASVWFANLGLAAIITLGVLLLGPGLFLAIYLPPIILAATAGIWLFYVQHQFDPNYWARAEQWDRVHASLRGSSYYKLPRVLQYFTGSIGLHHIHHLDSRIPNYHLQRCLEANRDLLDVPPLTMRASLRCPGLKLWDERTQRMVTFGEAHAARPAGRTETTRRAAA